MKSKITDQSGIDVMGWDWLHANDDELHENMEDWALHYLDLGWNVMPIEAAGKKPRLREWEFLQSNTVTPEMVSDWWGHWPHANIAVICGKISGIVCLDIDDESRCSIPAGKIPATATSQTSRGFHYFFRYPKDGETFPSFKGDGYDLQSDGKYVIIPPSEHRSGKFYQWKLDPWHELEPFAEIPEFLHSLARQIGSSPSVITGNADKRIKPTFTMGSYFLGVKEHDGRNIAAARLCGYLLNQGRDDDELICTMEGWNLRNKPPLSHGELMATINSVYKKHHRSR